MTTQGLYKGFITKKLGHIVLLFEKSLDCAKDPDGEM